MQLRHVFVCVAVTLALASARGLRADAGDPETGRRLFGACAACHSTVPGRHMTGPSLASIWGRTAGTVEGFTRYSKALGQADVVWDESSLDAWLADPEAFIPNTRMTFRGMPDEGQRRDLIAFLRSLSEQEGAPRSQEAVLDLKTLEANNRIASISLCGDTYKVTAETGETYEFWEFNLRFKTDGGESGPRPGQPVIIPGGMRGDRAFVVFASPAEMSPFIKAECGP